ncbi:hypothetical protein [Candidatus Parabeggiatoa sp. HSG14]|uniref:hypothetical protein n=1 Tax=Candidatus Parabeggiatoa sp. HSG14 TaxID=3055593 RepID=UPI0025A71BA1|nr:hypothetical protein [Thiotrichales bacterium HSG14]
MMKIYRGTMLCLCFLFSSVFAETQPYENPFISSTEVSAFVISATTGFTVPATSNSLVQSMQTTQLYSQVSNKGVNFNIPNQRNEYLKLMETGNIKGKAVSIEKIGDAGARQYAHRMNFEPLFQGKPGQGKGFDQVYRSGKQIVVVEAKGGGSPLKQYYGYTQGTGKYSFEVAKRTLSSPTATQTEKQAAKEVIKAYKNGRLVVQVARTKHVDGTPKGTTIETIYGKLALPSTFKIAHQAGIKAGLAGAGIIGVFELLSQLSSKQQIDWKRVGNITALGGISGYAGTFTGTLVQHSLVNNQSMLLSKLSTRASAPLGGFSGGMMVSAVFSYGAYFLGYSDLKTANRNMIAGGIGAAAGTLASATAFGLVAAFGTAGTGTAIASLSGAAATNATLAVIGGGTLAAGGGGAAAGATILTGGAALVVIGIGAGIMYMYHLGDESTERERVQHLLASVQSHLNKPL